MIHSIGRRAAATLLACACGALATAAPAAAVTITLGSQDLSASDPFAQCGLGCTAKVYVPTALPGATLVAPADGTITSWRVKGNLPKKLRLRIVRDAGGGQFEGVATSGIAAASDGGGSTAAAIGIKAGEQVGVELNTNSPNTEPSEVLAEPLPGANWSEFGSGLADGATAPPTATGAGSVPLFNATVELQKPLIAIMSSTRGPAAGGDVVVLTGQHLAIAQSVKFGSVPANVLKADNNQVIAAAPPHAPGTVEVTIETAGGSSTESTADLYTYQPDAPAPDVAPKLWELGLSPRAFKAASRGPSARAAAVTGTIVSFRSSEAARTRFTVLKRSRGRWVRVPGAFTRQASPGLNSFAFSGRVKGKALPPGRYKLLARATDSASQRSEQLRRSFRVVGSGRKS